MQTAASSIWPRIAASHWEARGEDAEEPLQHVMHSYSSRTTRRLRVQRIALRQTRCRNSMETQAYAGGSQNASQALHFSVRKIGRDSNSKGAHIALLTRLKKTTGVIALFLAAPIGVMPIAVLLHRR